MAVYLNVRINYLSNFNCNYVISFDYHDNLLKRMGNLKFKNFGCTKRNQENIMYNNSQKNINHFKKKKKTISIKKTKKIIKPYICKNREVEITFRNCLIFWENKLFTIKFRE